MSLLLAAVLLMQDKDAEETFRRIEEPILKAKTIALDYKLSCEEGSHKWGGPGTLLLKEGNKVRFEWEVVPSQGPGSMTINITSDGEHFIESPARRRSVQETAHTVRLAFCAVFARLGVGAGGVLGTQYIISKNDEKLNIPEILAMSDLKAGDDDGALKTLTWTVTVSKTFIPTVSKPVPVKLWYDPKTFNPVKRTLTTMKGNTEVRSLEIYNRVSYDEPIPDEKFKLPEEKK